MEVNDQCCTSSGRARVRRKVAQDHFLQNKTGLDGFTKTNIIGDQKIDPRHGKRTHDRVELVFVHLDATAERGLQGFIISLGNGTPRYSICNKWVD